MASAGVAAQRKRLRKCSAVGRDEGAPAALPVRQNNVSSLARKAAGASRPSALQSESLAAFVRLDHLHRKRRLPACVQPHQRLSFPISLPDLDQPPTVLVTIRRANHDALAGLRRCHESPLASSL